jgi:hypothetical protein
MRIWEPNTLRSVGGECGASVCQGWIVKLQTNASLTITLTQWVNKENKGGDITVFYLYLCFCTCLWSITEHLKITVLFLEVTGRNSTFPV